MEPLNSRAPRLHRPRYNPEGYPLIAIIAAISYHAGDGGWLWAIPYGLSFTGCWWLASRFMMWWRWGVALRGDGDPTPYVRSIAVNPKEYVHVVSQKLDGQESWIIYRRRRSPFHNRVTWGKPTA